MKSIHNRRSFIRLTASAGLGVGLTGFRFSAEAHQPPADGKRVGIIGLDTSHSTAFTKELNGPNAGPELGGYKVVAAYPKGSNDIESSVKRIPDYIEEVKKYGVAITGSIEELLEKVDVVLLETNDGRPRLEQATKVIKAGKRLFVDKPVAASLSDVATLFATAKKYNVPVFSSSSLRYIKGLPDLDKSLVVGADTFSPAVVEKMHPDLFWYGIHGVESLFTALGPGCQRVVRVSTPETDLVVGTWADGRVGTFRGSRTGNNSYGGTVYTKKENIILGPFGGYKPLLVNIISFFETGVPPVKPEETLEIYAFMEAAHESKRQNGASVTLESVLKKIPKL